MSQTRYRSCGDSFLLVQMHNSTIDAPPGVPGVSKNPDNQTEVHSGELER